MNNKPFLTNNKGMHFKSKFWKQKTVKTWSFSNFRNRSCQKLLLTDPSFLTFYHLHFVLLHIRNLFFFFISCQMFSSLQQSFLILPALS